MRTSMLRQRAVLRAVLWAGLAAFAAASPAVAQVPPPPYSAPAPYASPEAAEIAACLCLGQTVSALGADMTAKQRSYDAVRDRLARLDSELQSERASVDVNNPQSVGHFRQLLERRDAAFRQSTDMVNGELSTTIARYNEKTNEYNARCANRPRDPRLLGQVQATLSCPAPY